MHSASRCRFFLRFPLSRRADDDRTLKSSSMITIYNDADADADADAKTDDNKDDYNTVAIKMCLRGLYKRAKIEHLPVDLLSLLIPVEWIDDE